MVEKLDWEDYENAVYEALRFHYPLAQVEKNQKIRGKFSKRIRQIDILIIEKIEGIDYKICVECKYYNKKIDIKTVESFIGMAADIEADIGLIITEKGYTKSALKRAFYNPAEIELDILSISELGHLQGEIALPYAEDYAALMIAPFGWIIDAKKRMGSICALYQRGLTFEDALASKEIAYVNYWIREKDNFNLNDLLQKQENDIREHAKKLDLDINRLEYLEPERRTDAITSIRLVDIEKYPGIEITGFIEFKEFIFFCVWFPLGCIHFEYNKEQI
jgi:hypothetical protein